MNGSSAAERMALTCIKMTRSMVATVAIALAAATSHAQSAGDADLLAAKDAAQRANWRLLDALRPRFVGHPLEAYPTYWLLAGSVDRADPGEVRKFLARYPQSPLAEGLRKEWLKALGASGSWELFRAEHPKLVSDDVEVTCYSFQDRLARCDSEAAGEARALFVSGREAPAPCDPVFAALAASGKIGEAETWERIRKVLAAGSVKDAKRANALLAARHRFNDKTLDRAAADPAAFLAREKSPILPRSAKELVIHAVARLARVKPDEAAERLALVAPRLGPDFARAAWGQLAWQAALNHSPRALDWYALAADTPLTDAQVAWKARAAMRAGNWKQVLAAIQALSPEEAREPAWRYWRARALRSLGAPPEAPDALLKGLARELNFYGILAAEETGAPAAPDWNAWHPQPADLERVRSMEGIQRALILYRVGLDNEAFREWIWAIRGLDDRDLLAAAEVANIANVPDRAINTADRTVQLHDFGQRYPTPHRVAMAAAARQWDLDEAMMYSIIRQESRFVAEARSRVGATGLMQIMPATAKWVARQIPVQPFRTDMLVRPEVNIQMGSYYFRRVLSDLGHPMLAAAAYNAGPARARRWRDERALEGAIYAETIPFGETRDYVKKVFVNMWFYRYLLTGRTASLRELLGTVPGRNGEPPGAFAAIIP
ncbi:MAG: transglycosylase SLT domain-containing protein [Usitatibacter sp.]